MLKAKHISDDELLEMLNGEGESERTRAIGDHLHQCAQCRNALDKLTAQSVLWQKTPQLLQTPSMSSSFPATSARLQNTVARSDRNLEPEDEPSWQYPISDLLEPPKHPEMMGRIGKYDIEREVGRGGMGVVLKAYDAELNRPLAIKILAPHLASHGTARKRFAQEACAAAGVLHPNVIAVHDVSNEGKTPFIVMQYISGSSLQTMVDQKGPLSEIEIVRIALQISSGLTAAHSIGLVHRDIKPANILVEPGVNRVLITDFGLARAEDDASLTRTGWLTGTPNYMSPEQTRGERPDQRSDLFSLGSLIYFLSTGRLPFRSESPLGVLNRIQNDEPTPVRHVNHQISKTLSDVISMLLAKSPNNRFQSAAELHELLERHLAYLHQPDISRPPVVKSIAKSETKHIRLGLIAAGALLVGSLLWANSGALIPWETASNPNSLNTSPSHSGQPPSNEPNLALTVTPPLNPNEPNAAKPHPFIGDQDLGTTIEITGKDIHIRHGKTISANVEEPSSPHHVIFQSGPVSGSWEAHLNNGKIHLGITRELEGADWKWGYSTDYQPDDFTPTVNRDSTKFTLKRKYGTITFQGSFEVDKGEGTFDFEGSESYREFLTTQGIPEASEPLLFRMFFAWESEEKIIANLQSLQKLGLDPETLQTVMVDGVKAEQVVKYQKAGLAVKEHILFILWRVGPDLITEYNQAGLDLKEHQRFIKWRVPASLLHAYQNANLDLQEHEEFINMRVPPQLITEYRSANLDPIEHKDFITHRVPSSLLIGYRKASLKLDDHRDFIQMRVNPQHILAYQKAGLSLEDAGDFLKQRIPVDLFQSYQEAGLEVSNYKLQLQQRVSAARLKSYIDANLDIEKYSELLVTRVDSDRIIQYQDAGFDPIEYKKFLQLRVESKWLTRYKEAGLDIHDHIESIMKRVDPAKIRNRNKSKQ